MADAPAGITNRRGNAVPADQRLCGDPHRFARHGPQHDARSSLCTSSGVVLAPCFFISRAR